MPDQHLIIFNSTAERLEVFTEPWGDGVIALQGGRVRIDADFREGQSEVLVEVENGRVTVWSAKGPADLEINREASTLFQNFGDQ